MQRIFIGLGAVVAILALIAAGWYFRPWSPYSPARMAAISDPERFPQTFQQMDEILPSREISAQEGAESLPRALETHNLVFDWDGAEKSVEAWMEESRTTGLMVLRDGVVVHEIYGEEAGPDSRHTSWSVAKSFVATLIAVAMQEGRIDSLDQTVEEFAPQFAGSVYGPISLHHLLMMSAGVDFAEIYAESGESDIRPFFFNAFIMRRDVDEMASEIESKRGPGEELDYVSPNTHVLSAVVRGIYEQPIAQIVEEKLWTPLGMADDASWLQNRPGDDGMAIGYCCLQATLQDYARMGQFYLQDGVWNGERILPEGWVNQATTPNAPFQEPNATYDLRGYGLHFWIPEDTQGEFFMAGVYGQYVWVDLERDIVIARTAGDAAWGARTAESFAVFRSLAETFAVEDAAPVETEDAE